MDLDYVHLVITIRVESSPRNPLVLFGIRRLFGEAFRKTCREIGSGSANPGENAWQQVFSQSLSLDESAVKRFQKPALPFVFQLPVLQSCRKQLAEIGLVLLAPAIPFLQQFVHAVELVLQDPTLQSQVRLSLVAVETASYGGGRHPVMDMTKKVVGEFMGILSLSVLAQQHLASNELKIRFQTPLRLMSQGALVREFSPALFLTSLLRRVSSSVHYSGGSELKQDFKWLAQKAGMVKCSCAGLEWQSWGSGLSGFTGEILLVGDLSEFHPFLLAGTRLGVGKGAAFGLGQYSLKDAPCKW